MRIRLRDIRLRIVGIVTWNVQLLLAYATGHTRSLRVSMNFESNESSAERVPSISDYTSKIEIERILGWRSATLDQVNARCMGIHLPYHARYTFKPSG